MSNERPAHVTFEVRAVEDREKSIKVGHPVYEDVVFAIVTPGGSNLVVDRPAVEWLASKKGDQAKGRPQDPFYRHYKECFDAFLEDREAPVEGIAIEMWPSVTPSELKTLQNAGVRTVEDLAAANETTLQRIGMGGRALKQRAESWLDSAENTGKVAEENAAMKAQLEDLKEIVERQTRQIEELTADKPKRAKKAA